MEPFIDSVVALSKAKEGDRRAEFKRFVSEFGTHYASTTEMGTRERETFFAKIFGFQEIFLFILILYNSESCFRISIERRYTNSERVGATNDDIKDCNTLSGVKVLGLQERSLFGTYR